MQDLDYYEVCKLELKYCEMCGGLWIRPEGSIRNHCNACKEVIAELAPPRSLPTGHSGRHV